MDASGRKTFFAYDSDNRLTTTTLEWDDPATTDVDEPDPVTQTIYDAEGRVTDSIDADGNRTHTAYDPVGKVKESTDPFGIKTVYHYDEAGNLLETVNLGDGTVTRTAYDELNRPVLTVDSYHPGTPDGGNRGTRTSFGGAIRGRS